MERKSFDWLVFATFTVLVMVSAACMFGLGYTALGAGLVWGWTLNVAYHVGRVMG